MNIFGKKKEGSFCDPAFLKSVLYFPEFGARTFFNKEKVR